MSNPLAAIQLPPIRTAIRAHCVRKRTTSRGNEHDQNEYRGRKPDGGDDRRCGEAHARSVEISVKETERCGECRHRAQRELRIDHDQAAQRQEPERCPQHPAADGSSRQSDQAAEQPRRRQREHRSSSVPRTTQSRQQRQRQGRHPILGTGNKVHQAVVNRTHAGRVEVRIGRSTTERDGEHADGRSTQARQSSCLHTNAFHMKKEPPAATTVPAPRSNCCPHGRL